MYQKVSFILQCRACHYQLRITPYEAQCWDFWGCPVCNLQQVAQPYAKAIDKPHLTHPWRQIRRPAKHLS